MAPLSGVSWSLSKNFRETGQRVILVVPGKKEAREALLAFRGFEEEGFASVFPHYELNPYEMASPEPEIRSKRIDTLFGIASGKVKVAIATAEAFSSFTLPPGALKERELSVVVGEILERGSLFGWLVENGFERIPEVSDPGDFSVRGGIVDCYPPGTGLPLRIELDGDLVASIRFFDPDTQRTIRETEQVSLYPASELLRPREKEIRSGLPIEIESFLLTGTRYPGLEIQLPRIYGKSGHITNYFDIPPQLVFYGFGEIERRWRFLLELAHTIWKQGKENLPPPEELYGNWEYLANIFNNHKVTALDVLPERESGKTFFGEEIVPPLKVFPPVPSQRSLDSIISNMKEFLQGGKIILISVTSEYRRVVLTRLLKEREVFLEHLEGIVDGSKLNRGQAYIFISGIKVGFFALNRDLILVTERDILGKRISSPTTKGKRGKIDRVNGELLEKNGFVVHDDYGIGVFKGIFRKEVGDYVSDFGLIDYEGGDKLFLPVYRFDLIHPYRGGEGDIIRLDRLGSGKWGQTKGKVKERIEKVAGELISIYAAKEMGGEIPIEGPDGAFEEFASGFPFDETPDQERAIGEVILDLTAGGVMDRLVCGDVGYGKTEVALRAAFLTVMSGKQVALLCPTTVLADQHYRTFCSRFERFPVQVESLSRFVKGGRQREVLDGLRRGTVDIVIGTHRILQGDLDFRDLGLVVIDEEQKFGVMHKERLRKVRPTVNVLTLTATPIPRTLHITISGIRDISIISTPPRDRLSIRNFVVPFSSEVIQEALGRELRRGGQVYYIHNRVKTIGRVERFLREMFPRARIEVAHGQMKGEHLEGVMRRFYRGDIDVLLSTAIVESGLDVPRANTMVVDRAHTFGLSQLYQLRGRIGRERRRAYAYFIMPERDKCSPEALSRLAAIEEMDELGSGFQLASRDLDIRGSGDIVGPNQSGHIQNVGYEMYLRFLGEAVDRLKGREKKQWVLPDVDLGVPSYIPEEYIGDDRGKLEFYRKISLIRSNGDYREIYSELLDRYGSPPSEVTHFLNMSLLRSRLASEGVKELKMGRGKLYLSFLPESAVNRSLFAVLATERKEEFGFDRRGKFFRVSNFDGGRWDILVGELKDIFGREWELFDETGTSK